MAKAVNQKTWGMPLRSDNQRYSKPPITPPTAIARTVDSSTQITLQASGGATSLGSVSGYRYRRNGVVINQSPTASALADSGLSASTTYSYTATTVDSNGNESDLSTAFTATTATPTDVTAPTVAVIAAQALSASTIRISLTTPSTDAGSGLRDYTLQWSISSSGPWNDLQTAIQAAAFPITHSGLTASTQRFYRLIAFDVAGNSSTSSVVNATTNAASGTNLGVGGGGGNVAPHFSAALISSKPSQIDVDNFAFVSTPTFNGAGCLRSRISNGAEGSIGIRDFTLPVPLVQGDTFWFRWRTRYPAGFNFRTTTGTGVLTDQLKFFRCYSNTPGGGNQGAIDILIRHPATNPATPNGYRYSREILVDQGQSQSEYGSAVGQKITFDTWQTHEVMVTWHSSSSQGKVRHWVDNALIFDRTLQTLVSSNDHAQRIIVTDYWNVGAPATQDMYLRDVDYYSTKGTGAPANTDSGGRVFIGGTI